MNIFYLPNISGESVFLNEVESRHAVKVLRLEKGSRVLLVDGKGGSCQAQITGINPKKCQLSIIERQQESGRKNYNIHVAIAPTKNNTRFEWFLEKATEIGIDVITPLLCENSERKVIKAERFEKVLVSAMKQSHKAWLPKLNTLTPFWEFIEKNYSGQRFIAHCHNGNKEHLKNQVTQNSDALILIGPEGDFSKKEVEKALSLGFTEVSLGNSRLRTETAGVVSCHIVQLKNE